VYNKSYNYLIADTNFLPIEVKKSYNFISVFPEKNDDGAYRSNYNDLKKRGQYLSEYYNENFRYLLNSIKEIYPNASNEIRLILRPALVSLTNVYLDRSIRLLHRLKTENKNIKVVEIDAKYQFNGNDDFNNALTNNWELNHSIILLIARAIGIESKKILRKKDFPNYNFNSQVGKNFINTLFWPNRKKGFFNYFKFLKTKILRKVLLLNKSIFSKFSSLGFSSDDTHLALSGFYAPFGLLERQKTFEWANSDRNENLRENFLKKFEKNMNSAFLELIIKSTNNIYLKEHYLKISNFYSNYVAMFFPKNYLEGLELNLEEAKKQKNLLKHKHIIGTDAVRDKDLFFSVITKINKGKIIGFQHGGHYGYVESNSLHAEFEYSHYDIFLTYGWSSWDTELPKSKQIRPTVSPRLSELKREKWLTDSRKEVIYNDKNILFMLNVFHRFPHASTLCQARIDFNDNILDNLKNTFELLIEKKVKLDIKKYNNHSIDIRKEFFQNILNKSKGLINFIDIDQKGLSHELIKNYNLILWDQIGTGTLDCFVSRIPTIILWKRIYSKESDEAKKLVANLTKHGVVHYDHYTFVKEIIKYQKNPKIWMDNRERSKAIENFCNKYASTSSNWIKIWNKNLKEIINENYK